MDKSKIDFISNMLHSEKFNPEEKDRFLELVLSELKTTDLTKEAIKKQLTGVNTKITGLEKQIETLPAQISNQLYELLNKKPEKKTNTSKQQHNPKKVVEWLKKFTLDNYHLKWTVHPWDMKKPYDKIEDFFTVIKDEFRTEKFYDLHTYNEDLYWNKIYPFLFQTKLNKTQKIEDFGWGRNKIKIGWQFPETLKAWSNENFDLKPDSNRKFPFEMQLPESLQPSRKINNKKVQYFEDVVDLFKREIEFRDNDLSIEIQRLIKSELIDFEIPEDDLEELKGINFYTNVEMVLKAIKAIFGNIKSRTTFPNISIKYNYTNNNTRLELAITQIGSFSNKNVEDEKLTGNNGTLKTIIKLLNGTADFSIISIFKVENINKAKQINYLYEGIDPLNPARRTEDYKSEIKGFTYLITFSL
jgi:hypothetical protein